MAITIGFILATVAVLFSIAMNIVKGWDLAKTVFFTTIAIVVLCIGLMTFISVESFRFIAIKVVLGLLILAAIFSIIELKLSGQRILNFVPILWFGLLVLSFYGLLS